MTQPGSRRWLPTPALSTAVGACALLLAAAVLLHRQDLLVIALPMTVGTVLPLLNRAHRPPEVVIDVAARTLLEGESTVLVERLSSAEDLDLVRLRTALGGWLELPDGGTDICLSVAGNAPQELTHRLTSGRWGRGQVLPALLSVTTAHGLLRADLTGGEAVQVSTVPLREGFSATDLVPTAAGIVGAHRSLRPGDGIDPAGVRPFVVGDRLRRINWPVTSRTGQLHVTATYSDRDTEVVLVLDASVEVGYSSGISGTSSNIDISVRAAASVAAHYLRNGDRVGLLNLARIERPVVSRAGRAQLTRLMDVLLEVRPGPVTEQAMGRALGRISDRALLIVLSPLLGEQLPAVLAGISRAGRVVVVIDTLPSDVVLPNPADWTELAWRLQLLRREAVAGSLTEYGVPVVTWLGSGSLDQVLAGLSRLAGAPRIRR